LLRKTNNPERKVCMSKRFLILITLSVVVLSEIVASQSASAMETKGLTDFDLECFKAELKSFPKLAIENWSTAMNTKGWDDVDLKCFKAKTKSFPVSTIENRSLNMDFGMLVFFIGLRKTYHTDTYNELNSMIQKHLKSILTNVWWWDYKKNHDLRSKAKEKKWFLSQTKDNYLFFSLERPSDSENKLQKAQKKDSKLCFNLIADAFNDLLKTTLSHNVLIKTNKFLKHEPDLLITFYRDLLKFREVQHEMAHITFITPLIPPSKYELFFELPIQDISRKKKNFADDSFEDSELESNDTTESILFTHYEKITMPERSEDSNQNTNSTTDLKNSTIKTETTTELSFTLTQSNSSNSQESFNNIITPLFKNKGGCNNALNTEISTSEEKRSYGDRQVFALARMLLQAEESFNNDMSAPKYLLRNRGKCNNALNTEASSEENSSVGNTCFSLIYDSITYPEDKPKKGSMKKLPIRGSNQKSEEVN
jgi:hypothetical protein